MGLFSNKSERNMLMFGIQNAREAEQRAEALRQQGQTSAIGAIDEAQPLSLASLGAGYDKARTSYGEASDLYSPYAQVGKQGLDMYTNSLGLGGEAGTTAAQGAFHTSPGFTKRQDLATDAVARQASATGALGSGNTLQGITDRAYDLADQEYTGWQQGLQGLGQMGMQATGAQAGLQKGIGDLYASQGTGEAGIYSDAGRARAGVYTGMTGLGMSNIQGAANSIGGLTGSYMTHADDAAKNTWGLASNALGSLASLGGYIYGKKG